MGPDALKLNEVAMLSACQHKGTRRSYTAVFLLSPGFKALCIYLCSQMVSSCKSTVFACLVLANCTGAFDIKLALSTYRGKKKQLACTLFLLFSTFFFYCYFNDFLGVLN